MGDFILTLVAPQEYGVETFDNDPDIWTATDAAKTTITRETGESAPRDSCMSIMGVSWALGDGITLGDGYYLGDSDLGKSEGVYKDFTVTPEVSYILTCLYKVVTGSLSIRLWDQTNAALISLSVRTASSWSSEELTGTAPAGCTTMRVEFLQTGTQRRPGPYLIDNVALNGNILLYDPDEYRRIPERVGSFHQTLAGRRVYDLRAIHYEFQLAWEFFRETQYENLREIYYSNELLYFDDKDVPPLVESEFIYDTATYNFVGITNPSSTHIAYYDASSSLQSAEGDFETTEFSTAEYQAVDADDVNYKETSNPTAGEYLYHKFLFVSAIASADVERLRIKVVMSGNDGSPQNLDGGVLFAWNGTNWQEIYRVTSSGKTDMEWSTADSEVASTLVDSVDGYVRLLLRSRNSRSGANSLDLRSYFAECEINEDLDLTITLTHKAILDASDDVIWVKNKTQGTTLTLTTHYTIAADRRSITVTGQNSGDEIEVKYNRYFEVMFGSIPEEWFDRDPGAGDRERGAEVVLQTLSESK